MDFIDAFAKSFLTILTLQVARYFLLAGAAYAFVAYASKTWKDRHRIQAIPLKPTDAWREIKNSLMTILIYALIFGSLLNPAALPWTKVYLDPMELGGPWLIASFFLLALVHDTYFYWMHRALHHPVLLKYAHAVHHESRNPSPFASQSFHVIEAFFEMAWVIPMVFLIPIARPVLIGFSLFSFLYNIYGHLSVEIFPVSLQKWPGFRWLNTATHHNGHHRYFSQNYGLYFDQHFVRYHYVFKL